METLNNPADGLRLSCPGCGGGLRYDIEAGDLRCDRCGQSYEVSKIPDPSAGEKDGQMEVPEYRCPQCGAAVHGYETTAVSTCAFCGSDVVMIRRLSRLRRPDRIVPFAVSRERCEKIYRKRLQKAVFAPEALREQETVSRFQPIYIPFWQYRGSYRGPASGRSTLTTRSRKEIVTEEYAHDMEAEAEVSGVCYDASAAFDDETALRLCLKNRDAEPFHPGYLAGCFAEAPDVPETIYREGVKQYAEELLTTEFRNNNNRGNGTAVVTEPMACEAELVLLPVWLLAHRQVSGKILYTAVNGRTGEIVCDTPVSAKRFAVLTAVIAAAILASLLLLNNAFALRSRLLAGLCGVIAALSCLMIKPDMEAMLEREEDETDPTRRAIRSRNKRTDPVIIRPKQDAASGVKRNLPLMAIGVPAVAYTVLAFIATRKASAPHIAFISAFLSDTALFPAVMLAASGASVYFVILALRGRVREIPALFNVLGCTLFLSAILLLFIRNDLINYLIAIALTATVCLLMLRQFRGHNAYVTRPVPIFEKEGDQT